MDDIPVCQNHMVAIDDILMKGKFVVMWLDKIFNCKPIGIIYSINASGDATW